MGRVHKAKMVTILIKVLEGSHNLSIFIIPHHKTVRD